jgi:hypothetical protein
VIYISGMPQGKRQSVERLREALRRQVQSSLTVSGEGVNCWFDEDSAAWSEIDVQVQPVADESPFVVVVINQPSGPGIEFMVRTWHHYAPEVWVIDAERSLVTRRLRDGTRDARGSGSILSSSLLPGVAIPVETLFRES